MDTTLNGSQIQTAPLTTIPPLCAYSPKSGNNKLATCPLTLTVDESRHCTCWTQRGRDLKLISCIHPRTYDGQPVDIWKIRKKLLDEIAARREAAQKQIERAAARQAKAAAKQQQATQTSAQPATETTEAIKENENVAKSQTATADPPVKLPTPVGPLWPMPLEIIGVTGEYQAGKSLFLATINDDPATTLYYDMEKSSGTYAAQIGFTRVDFPQHLAGKFPRDKHPKGYRPVDIFTEWRDHVLSQPTGKWKVIAVDPADDLQSGLVAWVKDNASYFGRTPAQYLKMSQLMWGDAKAYLKQLLNEIAARCETFAFSTHMRDEYKGERKTGKRSAKGLETFYEMCSLYLELERKVDKDGAMPSAPVGIVTKDRLAKLVRDPATGIFASYPVVPKRIPVCTPTAIRTYMLNPVGLRGANADELLPEKGLSDDDKAQMRLESAQAERDTAMYQLELDERKRTVGARQPAATSRPVPVTTETEAAQPEPATDSKPSVEPIKTDTLRTLKDIYNQLIDAGLTQERWKAGLQKNYGVELVSKLTEEQAQQLLDGAMDKLNQLNAEAAERRQAEEQAASKTPS